jgi:DNA-binding ferritin-like protein (Dps family)
MNMSIFEKIFGVFSEKKEWREMENRAKTLPENYYNAYKAMQKYLWNTSGLTDWQETKFVFHHIIDLLEEAAADGKKVKEVTGNDVAAFCDDLVIDAKSWVDKQRQKLNDSIK